jgi:ribosomal protein S18 acetylase RimI-like enzyme
MAAKECVFRYEATADDLVSVRDILHSTAFFHDFEIEVAVDLVKERIANGDASGYHFIFAEVEGKTVGYTCFGDIPCTKNSYDIYWIGVHENQRGNGIGGQLLQETERKIRDLGGNGVYLETSGMEKYVSTRNFYLKYHYVAEAIIKDFYDYNDDKYIFVKRLKPSPEA